jgi:hypothetical protein
VLGDPANRRDLPLAGGRVASDVGRVEGGDQPKQRRPVGRVDGDSVEHHQPAQVDLDAGLLSRLPGGSLGERLAGFVFAARFRPGRLALVSNHERGAVPAADPRAGPAERVRVEALPVAVPLSRRHPPVRLRERAVAPHPS